MSQAFPAPPHLRLKRIYHLEQVADSQREQLRLHTAQLVSSVQGGGWLRAAAGGWLLNLARNAGPLTGLIRALVLRFSRGKNGGRKTKSPLLSTVLAGIAAAGLARWWKHRRDEE